MWKQARGASKDEVKKMFQGLKKAIWQIFALIDDLETQLKENHGWYTLPIVNHEFYSVNPYHYSLKQKSLNTVVQSIASTCGSGVFVDAMDDFKKYCVNEHSKFDILMFVHDALYGEVTVSDMFVVSDIIKYWTTLYFLLTYTIPTGFDIDFGYSRMEHGTLDYKYSQDLKYVDFSFEYLCLEDDTSEKVYNKFKKYLQLEGDLKYERAIKMKSITGANINEIFAGSYRMTKYSFKKHPVDRISGRCKVNWDITPYLRLVTSNRAVYDMFNKKD